MKLLPWLLVVLAFAAEAPEQPIPYSHKVHVGAGMKCAECHVMPDPGEMMTFPATSKCMSCHVAVKKDSAAIQKLASFAESKRRVPWVRIWQIPSYVSFSHKAHIEAGASCAKCHGEVKDHDRLARETDMSMTGCMNCHRETKASVSCTFCHEERR